jgi:hypothetical protein
LTGSKKKFKNQNVKCKIVESQREDFLGGTEDAGDFDVVKRCGSDRLERNGKR